MKFVKLFLLLFLPLFGSEEIRIYLNTTTPLQPIYIKQIGSVDGSFKSDYLKQLESVFAFDFSHNGATHLAAANPEKEQQPLTSPIWKKGAIAHVIQASVERGVLTCQVYSSQTSSLKQFPPIQLTGSLPKDRRVIHQLADAIYKSLYHKEGVASTRIHYAVKQQQNNKWVSEIWVCDWDGGNARQLTREGNYSVTPVPLPRSDNFLYVSYKQGQPKIFISSPQGVGKRLIDLRGNQLLPALSRKRDKIAFVCDASGTADLFLQEFHPERGEVGKPSQLFSYPHSTQASPTFSPDGTKLAFVSDKDGSPKIYVIPAHFSPKRATPTLISRQNRENSCPSWSPDGKKLAYSAKTKGVRQIWIYDFETQEEWQLTDGSENKENPSWALDSQHLVFNSTDGHISELYIVNLNQPHAVKISHGAGVKHYPTWDGR